MKSLFFSLILLFSIAQTAWGQNFYDINTVQDIYITFTQSNWDYILDTMRQNYSSNRLVAQSVSINGTTYSGVGVSYKGNSSYNANNAKNPLHLELDYTVPDQNYLGYEHIKLSNGSHDPSFVREVLSYDMLRNYVPVPTANYARVYVNGNYHGLYGNVEAVNKQFNAKRFNSSDNAFFMCDKPDGITVTTPAPNLAVLGSDSSAYLNAYTIESVYGWNDLVNLCDNLNNNTANVSQVLNIDRSLWMLAFNNLFVNLDSYTGSIGHNYYIYKDDNGQFNPIIWDLNESFGRFANSGTAQLTFSQMRNLDPLLHSTSTSKPLIKKLLEIPTYRKMYMAHLRTMLTEMVTSNYYKTRAQAIQSIIATDVQNDPNGFYSYAAFSSNVLNDVSGGGGPAGSAVGLASLMDARATYLLSNSEITKVPPTLSNISTLPTNPDLNTAVTIRATVGLPATNVLLAYRYNSWQAFTQVSMFDDGLHNDGAANDGIFAALIPANTTVAVAQYYVYAENDNAGIFSPQRAQHEFYTLNYNIPDSPINVGDVVINEILAANLTIIPDNYNEYDDWIELHNNTPNPLPLYGLHLSDNALNPTKWELPLNAVIPANGYFMIWADEDSIQGSNHANFKLSKNGEQVQLYKNNGSTLLDEINFGTQTDNVSTGRYVNGTGSFTAMPPSFNSQNMLNNCAVQPSINGNTTTCNGNVNTYQVTPIAGATYTWTVVNGTIISGQGTAQIQVQWDGAPNSTGSVYVVRIEP
jgi:hypothetical protein